MKNLYIFLAMGVAVTSLSVHGTEMTPDDCVNSSVISMTPEGTLYDNLFRSGSGIYCYGGQLLEENKWDGEIGQIVVNGDKLYYYNPLISGQTYTWLEGELSADGNRVTFHTPQLILGDNPNELQEFLCNTKYDEATSTAVPDAEKRDIIFSYDNGVLELIEGMPGIFEWQIPTDPDTWEPIGDTPEWCWSGYADTAICIEDFKEAPQTPPAGLTLEEYVLYSYQAGVQICLEIGVGILNDEVWIQGLEKNYPEAFVKGTLKDNVLTFETQFICLDEKARLFQFLLPATASFDGDGMEATGYTIADKAELAYDPQTGTFTAPREECLFVNGGKVSILALSLFEAPQLRKKNTEPLAAPADPIILQYLPYDEDMGFGAFAFALPQTDLNGNFIPTAQLYYTLYDGEKEIPLDPELFPSVEEYMVEIPYDWWCDDVVPNGCTRTVYFYYETENPGVCLIYDNTDGTAMRSTTVYASQSNIEGINTFREVSAEEYFDLTGRKVIKGTKGLLVKRTRYTDGTVQVRKLMVR